MMFNKEEYKNVVNIPYAVVIASGIIILLTTGVGMDECQGYFPKSIHDENFGRSSLIKMGLQHHPEFYKWVMDLSY